MIPHKKKTPEEIAALRDGMVFPQPVARQAPAPELPVLEPSPPADSVPPAEPLHAEEPAVPYEPVVHLDIPDIPVTAPASHAAHRLRKNERPLAPASVATHKTPLPTRRHDPSDIAQIRKREALAQLHASGVDPAAHLRAQTASPFLYAPGYVAAGAAAIAVYQRVHHITPLVLVAFALLITVYIAARKPRSRHHAALIFIIVFLTLGLGSIHYAPLFQHGT